jgi:hypothetical protein
MDIVKYQLAAALKNFAARFPEHGIDAIGTALISEIAYIDETSLSATIEVRHNGRRRKFEFRLIERG